MQNFRSDNRTRDRKDFSRGSFGGRDSRRPVLFSAVCDECGKDCQVPFKPSGDKPIYCSECFEKKGGRDSNRSGQRDFRGRNFGDRNHGRPQNNISDRSVTLITDKIDTLNSKLDKILSLLSATGEKKPKPAEGKTAKSQKPKTIPADKTAKAIVSVEEEDIQI